MSYWHPRLVTHPGDFHPALVAHHEELRHRLVSDPVNVAPGGAVDPLHYHNGPTIPDPQVVNLFAGNFWDDKDYVNSYTGRVVENGYLAAAEGQGTKPGKFLGGFDIAPPPSDKITDAQIRAMLQAAVGRNGIIAPNPNALFVVLFPDGVEIAFDEHRQEVSCGNFCGFHSNDGFDGQPLYYTVQPATICQGCYQTSPRIGLQMVIAHEIVEACTDPAGTGWFNDSTGQENADECAWVQDQYGGDIVQGYAAQNAQGQWVNSLGDYVAPKGGGGGQGWQPDPTLTALYAWEKQAADYIEWAYGQGTAEMAAEALKWQQTLTQVTIEFYPWVRAAAGKSTPSLRLPQLPRGG